MRDLLSTEEAERRNRECKKRYYEKNKQTLREKAKALRLADPEYNRKRREHYREKMALLIDEGLFQPAKRGRKRIYETPEEAMAAKKEQMKIGRARRKERLAAALKALNEKMIREDLDLSSEDSD
jgi:hypothetical protein